MIVQPTDLPGVLIVEPRVFRDERGFFFESWSARRFEEATGVSLPFVQDNHSASRQGVLRGIHYQRRRPQGKLVRAAVGSVLDVAVDLRRSSPHFGRWTGAVLSADSRRQLWIPPGFGHAFLALSEGAEVLYKTTDYYDPDDERCIHCLDPQLAIAWPDLQPRLLSPRDAQAPTLAQAEVFD